VSVSDTLARVLHAETIGCMAVLCRLEDESTQWRAHLKMAGSILLAFASEGVSASKRDLIAGKERAAIRELVQDKWAARVLGGGGTDAALNELLDLIDQRDASGGEG
jgi:type II secretory pathway component PulL